VTVSGHRGGSASRDTRKKNSRNGRQCRRCHKFGTFGPDALVCDTCMGTLPLVFITVTVVANGGEQ
jgi:hypothetical protein